MNCFLLMHVELDERDEQDEECDTQNGDQEQNEENWQIMNKVLSRIN